MTFTAENLNFSNGRYAGIVGTLDISHQTAGGLRLSVQSADIEGNNELDFDSIGTHSVPFYVSCIASDNLGNNTYLDSSSGGEYLKVDHNDLNPVCLETDNYVEDAVNLKVSLYIAIENYKQLLFDPAGYINENLTFTLSDK